MSPLTPQTAVVDPRHEGPPGCGNGGWVCGMLTERLDALSPPTSAEPAATVRLSTPTPLATPLRWQDEGDTARLLVGETLVGTARRAAPLELTVLAPVPLETARDLAARYDLTDHPYPGCYVCGPDAVDGLHVYAAEVPGRAGLRAATVTITEPGLPPVLAALDCPGGWAVGFGEAALLLGTFTTQVCAAVPRDRELVVLAWETGREGRKRHCGSALLDGDQVVAAAAATWVEVGRDRIPGTAPASA